MWRPGTAPHEPQALPHAPELPHAVSLPTPSQPSSAAAAPHDRVLLQLRPLVPRQAKQHRVASSSSRAPSQSSFSERLSTWVGAKPAAGLPAAGTSLCLALGPELCSSVSLPWDVSCPAAFGEGMPRATLVPRIPLHQSQPMGAAGGMQPIPPLLHTPQAGAACPLVHLALSG